MSAGRSPWLLVCLAATLSGCARTGSALAPRSSTGTLKASLSHMEYENQQLRRELASQKAEARQAEDRLVQEEAVNGDLSARLDDAKALLRKGGALASGDDPAVEPVADGPTPPRNLLPAGRANRKRRKPPFAQIGNRVDALPSEDEAPPPGDTWEIPARPRSDLGPQSRLDVPQNWLPIARGTTTPSTPRR